MNIELLTLNGYGQFVWPAFIFSFVSCFVLYLKTKNEMKKQEKMYLDKFEQIETTKIKVKKERRTLSDNPIFKTH